MFADKAATTKKFLPVVGGEINASRPQVKADSPKKHEDSLVDLFDSAPTNNTQTNNTSNDFFGLNSNSPTKKNAQNEDNLDDLFGSMVAAPSFPGPAQSNNSFAETKHVDQISSGLESLDFNAPSKGIVYY